MSANVKYTCNFIDKGTLVEALEFLELAPHTTESEKSDITFKIKNVYGQSSFQLNNSTKKYDLITRDYSAVKAKRFIQSVELAYAKVGIEKVLIAEGYSIGEATSETSGKNRKFVTIGAKLI